VTVPKKERVLVRLERDGPPVEVDRAKTGLDHQTSYD
jgi:hypothetical protein